MVYARRRTFAPVRRGYPVRASRVAARYSGARRLQVRVRRPVRPSYNRRGYSGRRVFR